MSDHEIVTQHFDDPIGSFIHVDGKCYVKISNKTDMINTPVATDQNSVYYDTIDDCKKTRVIQGRMLCPPKNVLLFSTSEASMNVIMSFDIPSQALPPTSVLYVKQPVVVNRSLTRAVVYTDTKYTLPTESTDRNGMLRSKAAAGRAIMRAVVRHGEAPSVDIINKMLHK
jgi:hypothetical protein